MDPQQHQYLQVFHELASAFRRRPFVFLEPQEQGQLLMGTREAVATLKQRLEAKNLTESTAYTALTVMENALTAVPIDEGALLTALRKVIAIHKLAKMDMEMQQFLDALGEELAAAEQQILEYTTALELLRDKAKGMTPEEQGEHDLQMIQERGVFYVLEYTLQVLFEFSHRGDEERKKLLTEGLQVEAANLPSLVFQLPSLRKELCYAILDDALRAECFRTFFTFEDVLASQDRRSIGEALKAFNIALLEAFERKGLQTFHALVLRPFGNDVSPHELLKNVKECRI